MRSAEARRPVSARHAPFTQLTMCGSHPPTLAPNAKRETTVVEEKAEGICRDAKRSDGFLEATTEGLAFHDVLGAGRQNHLHHRHLWSHPWQENAAPEMPTPQPPQPSPPFKSIRQLEHHRASPNPLSSVKQAQIPGTSPPITAPPRHSDAGTSGANGKASYSQQLPGEARSPRGYQFSPKRSIVRHTNSIRTLARAEQTGRHRRVNSCPGRHAHPVATSSRPSEAPCANPQPWMHHEPSRPCAGGTLQCWRPTRRDPPARPPAPRRPAARGP